MNVLSSGGSVLLLIYLVVIAAWLIGNWILYSKAGRPGWASIIPIYSGYVLLKIVGRPGWWLILFLIPVVNLVTYIIVMLDLAKAFGKGSGFGVGLMFLPFIFIPILGFGEARYRDPGGAAIMA
jgi:hypothetical protein